MMTVFLALSWLQQAWKHLSQSETLYCSLSSFWPALGMQAVMRQNFSNSMVITRPYWECYFYGRSQVIDIGRYLEKIATPEQPAEHLQKFQQPWQPASLIGSFWQASKSILVSFRQRISGFTFSKQFCSSFLLRTARTPFTFHELINSLFGVTPLPYSHSLVWSQEDDPDPPLNCLDLVLLFLVDSSTISEEKSLVCFQTFFGLESYPSAF